MTVPAALAAIQGWKDRDVRAYTRAVGNELGDALAHALESLVEDYNQAHEDLVGLQVDLEEVTAEATGQVGAVVELAQRLHLQHPHGWQVCADRLCTLVREKLVDP